MLNFPYMNVSFDVDNEIILISGGRPPSIEWFKQIQSNHKIICIDKGIDFCKENNIVPDLLIGDFDSANETSVQWAISHKIKIERHPVDKDFTDTQLALEILNENQFAILTGVFGGNRSDHLFSTLFSCANSKIKNCLIDEHEAVLFLNGGENLQIKFLKKPIALSLLPISEICEGVSIEGVHWNLSSATLKQSMPSTVSNRVESKIVNVSIKFGRLAIYFYFGG